MLQTNEATLKTLLERTELTARLELLNELAALALKQEQPSIAQWLITEGKPVVGEYRQFLAQTDAEDEEGLEEAMKDWEGWKRDRTV